MMSLRQYISWRRQDLKRAETERRREKKSMAKSRKMRLGVLTSGGDCAGLNAIIRAVVYRALEGHGWQVFGIREGTRGLLERPMMIDSLDLGILRGGTLLREGGTMLGTVNKGNPFAYPMPDGSEKDRSQEVIDGFNELKLDALVGIGGDGSMRILSRLAQQGGIQFIGVPKTIDNDVAFTEFSVGFSTAVDTAVDAWTACSRRRPATAG